MAESYKELPLILASIGPLEGKNWSIVHDLLIGRDSQCDIVINDRQVSRQHAKVIKESNKKIRILDMNSKNGTYLNGERITETELLNDGDEIKIALIQNFLYVSSDATLPLEKGLQPEVISEKKLFVDKKARRVWIGEKELVPPLSALQYELLLLLYENEDTVVGRQEVVEIVWGIKESAGVSEQAIDALVRRLRARLSRIEPNQEYIITVRGVGFMLQNYYL